MRAAVLAAAPGFMKRFEGAVPWMYVDILDLVTTGYGNLIDSSGSPGGVPWAAALALPWGHRSGGVLTDVPATAPEIIAEWQAVKNGRIPASRGPRPLGLTAAGVLTLVKSRLLANEAYLARRWANWASWPADAQLGAHSCAWAAGAGWRAPHFDAAVAATDFATCAGADGDADSDASYRGEAWLNDGFPGRVTRPPPPGTNPGLRPRNLANKLLFANAARVVASASDPDILHWPGSS